MIHAAKYCFLICMFFSFGLVHANTIDCLQTKEDVRNYLRASIRNTGVIFLTECVSLLRPAESVLRSRGAKVDSIEVQDPVTLASHLVALPNNSYKDTDVINPADSVIFPSNYSYADLEEKMNGTPWSFQKLDVDQNGLTDLVIDGGTVVIVLDMGDRAEAHMFSSWGQEWDSYNFKGATILPDRTFALLLRHNHNSCTSIEHFSLSGTVTFIVDTLNNTGKITFDTLYKITAGIDSIRKWNGSTNSYKTVANKYSDTVDMHLYNSIDTIVYKFHGFAHYNNRYTPANISKIIYCYDLSIDMTNFERHICIEIDSDGQCTMNSRNIKSVFTAHLDKVIRNNLWNFTSYIDVKSLKDEYQCEEDHAYRGSFFTYFSDGSVKAINIWAYFPPIELGYLSNLIAEISRNVYWQPLETTIPFERPHIAYNIMDTAPFEMCRCN
ncbi:MAG: hypothetical protein H0X33_03510 [Taibaiella sp.]|nr:hypothetical protein [Taibaiella sp.]